MDNERTNEFEREPEDTVTAAEQETAADETVGQPETAEGEEKTEAAPETEAAEESEKISEEEAEETTEEPDVSELCLACGERRRAEGSDYCAECEERMSSTKIPLLGWVAGFAAVIAGIFAMGLAFLISAPALQVYKGDMEAAKGSWYPAYSAYSQIDDLVSSVNEILKSDSPFVRSGYGVKLKIFKSIAHSYSPLEAAYSAESIFSTYNEHAQKNAMVKECTKFLTDYQNTYEAVADAVEKMQSDEATVEETLAAFDEAATADGVNAVFLNYLKYNVATYKDMPDADRIKFLEAAEAADSADKSDYSWLYSLDYARLLMNVGQSDKALTYLDKQLKYDKSSFNANSMKMRLYLAEGKTDEAARVMQEYKAACKGTDTAYQLEISYLRSVGELDKARELCTEALKEYGTSPEIYRQSALIYLMNGDYDNAYEDAYEADYAAYQIYQYTGDNSAYTQELSNTIYLCSWLCKEKGKKDTDNAAYIDEILSSFSESEISDSVLQIIKGDKTLEEVLTKGECDLI